MNKYIDDYGEWEVFSDGSKALIAPSEVWKAINQPIKTAEQIKIEKTADINAELAELDKKIPRIVEDMIKASSFKPYASKQAIIDRKQQLRDELKNL